jgi:hypothetical protein
MLRFGWGRVSTIVLAGLLALTASNAKAQSYKLGWQRTSGLNANQADVITSVTLDPYGNAYYVGHSWFLRSGGSSDSDLVVRKVGPTGTVLWTKVIDIYGATAPRPDVTYASALDRNMNLYVSAWAPPPANSNGDFTLVKLTPTGTTAWTKIWNPGAEQAYPYKLVVHPNGNVTQLGVYGTAAAAIQYTGAGALVWKKVWRPAGTSLAEIHGATALANGNIAITGTARTPSTGKDVWVSTLNGATGVPLWSRLRASTYFPAADDIGRAITSDSNGNLYSTGSVGGTGGLFVAQHTAAGAPGWYREITSSGSFQSSGRFIEISPAGGILVGGNLRNDAGTGTQDLFVVRYTLRGAEMWRRWVLTNIPSLDIATGFAVDAAGAAYIAGTTSANAGNDPTRILVSKLNPTTGAPLWSYARQGTSPTLYDEPSGFAVDRRSGHVYIGGHKRETSSADALMMALYQRPIAQNDSYVGRRNTVLIVNPASGVFRNDTFWLYAQFSLLTQPANGTVSFTGSGGFRFLPSGGFTGTTSFRYRLFRPGLIPVSDAVVTIRIDP